MKRRKFLIFGAMVGLSACTKAKKHDTFEQAFAEAKQTIEAVQSHMFPQNAKLPSAAQSNAIGFLLETMRQKSFDKDTKKFVLEGANDLSMSVGGRFALLSFDEKEHALRMFEQSDYGSAWLSQVMSLTMEALFSAPIYGANINEMGWRSIGAYGGYPRPKTKYLES